MVAVNAGNLIFSKKVMMVLDIGKVVGVKILGLFEVDFLGVEEGKVVMRFFSESSGILYIGYVKAALFNYYFV